jgi:hypothetical protein
MGNEDVGKRNVVAKPGSTRIKKKQFLATDQHG